MNTMEAKLRGILLDFEGTIAQTERYGQRLAYNHAFSELGLDWNWTDELYADLLAVAGGKERLRFYLAHYHPELLDRAVKDGLIDELHRLKTRHFAAIAPAIPFRSGIQRLIYEAHCADIRIAIVTNASKPSVEALLAQDSALSQMVDVIAASDAVALKKPAADIYRWTLARLNLAPQECVAIEDSQVGLHAALGAGITTLITVSQYTVDENFAGAAAVVSDLGDDDRPARALSGPSPKHGVVDLDFIEVCRTLASQTTMQAVRSSDTSPLHPER